MRWSAAVVGGILGLAVTPLAIFVSVIFAGAGHGSYIAAKALFPYSMLLTLWTGNSITNQLIILGCTQFPAYGFFVGLLGFDESRGKCLLAGILAAHVIAAGAAMASLPNFP